MTGRKLAGQVTYIGSLLVTACPSYSGSDIALNALIPAVRNQNMSILYQALAHALQNEDIAHLYILLAALKIKQLECNISGGKIFHLQRPGLAGAHRVIVSVNTLDCDLPNR